MTPKETLYGYIKDHIEVLGENLKGSTPNNSMQQELLMIKRLLEKHDEQHDKQQKILDILKNKLCLELHSDYLCLKSHKDEEADFTILFFDTQEEYDLLKEWLND